MKKRIIAIVVATVMILCLAACGTTSSQNQPSPAAPASSGGQSPSSASTTEPAAGKFDSFKPVDLVVSSGWSPPGVSYSADFIVEWENQVTEATEGKITFTNYWGGAMGAANEQITLLEAGTIDIGLLYGWMTEDLVPLWDFNYVLPFGPEDMGIVTRANWQIMDEFPQFAEEMAAHNAKCLVRFPNAPYFFAGRNEINSLDDLKNLNIGAVGARFAKWFEPLNSKLTSANKTERYSMLQLNVIDASCDCETNMYEYSQVEMAPNVFIPNILVPMSESVLINTDKFNSLPAEFQEILVSTGREMSYKIGDELMPKACDEIIEKWKATYPDLKIVEITAEERAWWAANCPDTATEWCQKIDGMGLPGTEIIKRYKEICEEMGFKW